MAQLRKESGAVNGDEESDFHSSQLGALWVGVGVGVGADHLC